MIFHLGLFNFIKYPQRYWSIFIELLSYSVLESNAFVKAASVRRCTGAKSTLWIRWYIYR